MPTSPMLLSRGSPIIPVCTRWSASLWKAPACAPWGRSKTSGSGPAALLSFIEQTAYDDIDGLKIDYRTLPRWMITTTSHDCLRRKCPFFGVVLLRPRFAPQRPRPPISSLPTIASCSAILPPTRLARPSAIGWWMRAHSAESEARRAFSLELAEEDILSLARRVASEESRRNVFVRAERTVVMPGNELDDAVLWAHGKARRGR